MAWNQLYKDFLQLFLIHAIHMIETTGVGSSLRLS